MKNKFFRGVLGGICFIAFFAGFIAISMLLWNALLPSIFGLPALNYWQTAGLLILARLFFGGMGHGHGPFGGKRRNKCKNKKEHLFGHMNEREFGDLRDRLKGMSREERRDYVRERINKHYNHWEEYFDDMSTSQSEK
jgi:hypothetical protein